MAVNHTLILLYGEVQSLQSIKKKKIKLINTFILHTFEYLKFIISKEEKKKSII